MSSKVTRLPHDNRPVFARNLNDALRLRGETAENFSRRIDRTLRTVQRWRSGESAPGAADALLVAQALGVTVEALFTPAPPRHEPDLPDAA